MAKGPRVWIVDGHNLIFQLPQLERLQTSGRRTDARKSLESMLRGLSADLGEKMIVVYDGNRMERNPDAIHEEGFQTIYSFPPEEADDRILHLCDSYLSEGWRVRVVTSDQRTLGRSLPAQVSHITADELRLLLRPSAAEKSLRGDFSDVEAELLRRGEGEPREAIPPGAEGDRAVPSSPAPSTGQPAAAPASQPRSEPARDETEPELRMPPMSEAVRLALERKKARGRRKQERRRRRRERGRRGD